MKLSILIILYVVLLINVRSIYGQTWQWAAGMGGPENDNVAKVCTDAEGNSYTTGVMGKVARFDSILLSNGNTQNVYLALHNVSGRIIWAKAVAFATDSASGISVNAMAIDKSGELYLAGNYLGSANFSGNVHTSIAPSEIYLAKFSSDGELKWVRTAGGNGIGTYNQNAAFGLCLDSSGNCYITGSYVRNATFDSIAISSPLPHEVFIAKYDSNGKAQWARSGEGDFGIHTGLAIAAEADGTTYVTGSFFGHLNLDRDSLDAVDAELKMFLVKLSPSGDILWAKKIGSGGYYGASQDIIVNSNGTLSLCGFFRSTMDFGSFQLSYNNGLVYAVFVARYDRDGSLLWAKQTDGSDQSAVANGIAQARNGAALYITGSFASTTSFGPITLKKAKAGAMFVTKLDSSGRFLWALPVAGDGSNTGISLAVNGDGLISVAGDFFDTISAGTMGLRSAGKSDIFLARLSDFSANVVQVSAKSEASFYPNPFRHTTTLFLATPEGYANVSIVDLRGKVVARVYSGTLAAGEHRFNWSNSAGVPDGMYECLVRMKGRVETLPVMLLR